MIVTTSQLNNYEVIHVSGRVDTMTAPKFESDVLAVIDQGASRIVVDCRELEYISSSGLRVFLVAQKKMLGLGGTLKLAALQPPIQEIFDISGFSQIFSIVADVDEAAGK